MPAAEGLRYLKWNLKPGAIFGETSGRMYRYEIKKAAWRDDRFAAIKTDYERRGRDPSNLRYGYVAPPSQAS